MQRANTFSICAVDRERGEAGVVVASRFLGVGGHVPYVEPGAGAVATQAVLSPTYGQRGLDLMSKGMSAKDALDLLTKEDLTITADDEQVRAYYKTENMSVEGTDYTRDEMGRLIWFTRRIRQVGMVSWDGQSAAYSGPCVWDWSGSITGPGFACQGNCLAGAAVLDDAVAAFNKERDAGNPLQRSLVAALQAGEAAGGDRRGKQAAGLLIVKHRGHFTGGDRRIDVRVDDDAEPVSKLAAIVAKF